MNKILVIFGMAFAIMFSVPVFANGANNNCNGNGSCVEASTGTPTTVTNNNSATGGTSSSTSVSVGLGGSSTATGGSLVGSGNSKVENVVRNVVGQDQNQGQVQGQSTENSNNSKQSTETNVTVQGDRYDAEDIPVSTAVAPTMFATAMCQAARSGAFQNQVLGISLGGTITDENCMKLEQFRIITNSIQDERIKHGMACLASPLYREASEWIGKECPAVKTASGSSGSKTFGQP